MEGVGEQVEAREELGVELQLVCLSAVQAARVLGCLVSQAWALACAVVLGSCLGKPETQGGH